MTTLSSCGVSIDSGKSSIQVGKNGININDGSGGNISVGPQGVNLSDQTNSMQIGTGGINIKKNDTQSTTINVNSDSIQIEDEATGIDMQVQ